MPLKNTIMQKVHCRLLEIYFEIIMTYKLILDACCGSRMFHFDKRNPHVLFADNRTFESTLCDGRLLKVEPDVIHDFTDMPYLINLSNALYLIRLT